MKKFSELSNKDRIVESASNKIDFINNLIEETLSVVDGEIIGKDTLVKTLNKIVEINDSKTKIEVLESVRVNAYQGGFDFNLISAAIEEEKAKLNAPIEEEVEVKEEETHFARPNDKLVSIRESVEESVEEETEEETEEVIKEAKKDDDECDDEDGEKGEEDECEQEKDDEDKDDDEDLEVESVKEAIEETEEVIEEAKKDDECDDNDCDDNDCDDKKEENCDDGDCDDDKEEGCDESVAVEEPESLVEKVNYVVTDEMQELSDLASLCEGIINEHHLNTKKEKIEYILDNSDLEEVDKKIKKVELEEMSDAEVDAAYLKCEKECK